MHQSPLTILTTNHITLPTTNHNTDQSITRLVWISNCHLTLKMTSTQDVEASVTTNSPYKGFFSPEQSNSIKVLIKIIAKTKIDTSWVTYPIKRLSVPLKMSRQPPIFKELDLVKFPVQQSSTEHSSIHEVGENEVKMKTIIITTKF